MEKWESREALEDPYHYSPAVHPEDILYAGSDTEETPQEVARKRSRYEYHAEQVAAGKLPVLLSASLRGPLSEEGGWTNPWRHVPQPKKNSSWWDPGSDNMLFTRENVLQRAASHGLGYMKPSEALAWCKATAEAEASQMVGQDIQGEVLMSVETDEQENEEDLFDQPPEDDDSMLPIEPAVFCGQTEKAKAERASDPPEVVMGYNDIPTAIKRPADSKWLKRSHISKRAKWDGPTMSSPTTLPTTLEERSHKRVDQAVEATNLKVINTLPLKTLRSRFTSRELTTGAVEQKSNNPVALTTSRYSGNTTPLFTRDDDHLLYRGTHHEALSSPPMKGEALSSYLKSSSKPIRRSSMKHTPGGRQPEFDSPNVRVDSSAHQSSIEQHPVHISQQLPRLCSPVPQNEFYGCVSPNMDENSFVTEVAPSSRDLEKFEYKKRRKKSHTESDRARSVMSIADDEEILYGQESARSPQQDELPDQDELMEEDDQKADRTPPTPVLPQETSLIKTCPNTEIHSVEPNVNPSESETNNTSWTILQRNSQALPHFEAAIIGPSASPIAPALKLSLADASPFHLTFSNHQSLEIYGRHESPKQRQVSLSPKEPQQISEDRYFISEEPINKYFDGEGTDDNRSESHHEIPNKQDVSDQAPEEVFLAEESPFAMSVVAAHQPESSSMAVLQVSHDPMDISTQSFNTTPTMSRRNPLPSSASTREVMHSESPSEGAQKQIMNKIQKTSPRNFESLNSQGGSAKQLFQSFGNARHLDEQPDHDVPTTVEDRTDSVSCSPTMIPQAEDDESYYETVEGILETTAHVELRPQSTALQPSFHSSPPSRQSPFIDVYPQSPFAVETQSGALEIERKPSPVLPLLQNSFSLGPPQEKTNEDESNASNVIFEVQSPFTIAEILHENNDQMKVGTPLRTPLDPSIVDIQHETDLVDSRPSSPSLEAQSPWAEETHIPVPTSLLHKSSPGDEPSQQIPWSENTKSSPHPLPKLDWDPRARPETPEYCGIRPFSDFMSPTPSPDHNTALFDDGLLNTQVLIEAATKNPWRSNLKNPHSRGSGKRVSFGILPNEATPLQGRISQTRMSSPPLQISKSTDVDYNDDNPPFSKKVSKLYGATKKIPNLVSKNENSIFSSPAFGAQAEAFIAADHEFSNQKTSRMTLDHSPTRHLKQRTSAMDNVPRARSLFDEYGFDRLLRDRARDRSPDLATFDMDDALGEAGDFLEDWSVDAELKKARSSENGRSGEREKKGNENGSAVKRNRLFGFL